MADCPWREQPFSWVTGSGRSVERHYGTMTIESLIEMGPYVKERAARDSMLFFWVTWPYLMQADAVARSWGFRYSSDAWVWVKGAVSAEGQLAIRHGRGHTTRKGTELCLLYRRGAGIPRASMSVSDVLLAWPEGRNSRKPLEQYARIEEFLGPGLRKIELFARKPSRAPNWTVWGDES